MSFQTLIRRFSLQTILSQRVPSIKFRAGQHSNPAPPQGGVVAATASAIQKSGGKTSVVQAGPVIEDYQLPSRYRRAPIDDYEVDYINRGGPE